MNNHYIHWITVFVFSKEVFELKLSAVLGFVKVLRLHWSGLYYGDGKADKNIASNKVFYLSEYKMSFEFHKYHKTSIVVWKTKYQILIKMTK